MRVQPHPYANQRDQVDQPVAEDGLGRTEPAFEQHGHVAHFPRDFVGDDAEGHGQELVGVAQVEGDADREAVD